MEFLIGIIFVAGVILLFKSVRMVPQGYEWTVERFGKYTHSLEPGLHLLVEVEHHRRHAALVVLLRAVDVEVAQAGDLRRGGAEARAHPAVEEHLRERVHVERLLALLALAPGQWISAGAITGVHPIVPGEHATASFGSAIRIACTAVPETGLP